MGQYSDMVKALAKPGEDILESMTDENWSILKQVVEYGVASSEELDIAKKQFIYQKDLGLSADRIVPTPAGLDANKCHLIHMALGIFGEAGELLAAVMAHCEGYELDVENCIEEGGDSEFYWEGFRQGLGIERSIILAHNMKKLGKRYHSGTYDNTHAQERVDKSEQE